MFFAQLLVGYGSIQPALAQTTSQSFSPTPVTTAIPSATNSNAYVPGQNVYPPAQGMLEPSRV